MYLSSGKGGRANPWGVEPRSLDRSNDLCVLGTNSYFFRLYLQISSKYYAFSEVNYVFLPVIAEQNW